MFGKVRKFFEDVASGVRRFLDDFDRLIDLQTRRRKPVSVPVPARSPRPRKAPPRRR